MAEFCSARRRENPAASVDYFCTAAYTRDAHAALITRMDEARRLRAHLQDLRNSIEKIKDSAEYRHDRRDLLRVFGSKVDGQVDTSRSGKALARLERDLIVTTAELELGQAAQAAAQAQWEGSKATLDNWEAAIHAQGPAAARTLLELPRAGAIDDQNIRGYADISAGENQTPVNLHESGKYAGRGAAVE